MSEESGRDDVLVQILGLDVQGGKIDFMRVGQSIKEDPTWTVNLLKANNATPEVISSLCSALFRYELFTILEAQRNPYAAFISAGRGYEVVGVFPRKENPTYRRITYAFGPDDNVFFVIADQPHEKVYAKPDLIASGTIDTGTLVIENLIFCFEYCHRPVLPASMTISAGVKVYPAR